MPSNYVLSSEQKDMKANLADSMSSFDEDAEGVLYAEREVFAFADTKEEAQAIAEAYHAELVEYSYGIATMKLTENVSVGRALHVAASSDNNLPAVYPNYYRYISEEIPDTDEGAKEEAEEEGNSPLEVEEEEYELEGADTDTDSDGEEGIVSQEDFEKAAEAYNDPYLSYNSSMYQWQHVNVGSVYAWNSGYTGQGIKVAVLDTGVTAMSGELSPAYNGNTSSSSAATDAQGHGTHVAGIIGARSNTIGGVGIAPNASIYNIKVLGDNGSGSDDNIIRGITIAMEQGVDIINMSLGGVGYNPAFQKKIDEAYSQGIAMFAAAGNDGGSNINYPAAYKHIICVAAVDTNNQRASFSNYGSWVDLSAPGVDIWSTGKDGSYVSKSGTSMACPVAVGEAAVILSANPSAIAGKSGGKKVDALESFMKANTVSAGSGMGKGIPSLTKAFKISVASAKPAAPTITAAVSGDAQKVSVTIKAEAGKKIYYTTNGKAPSFKNGVVGAGTQEYSAAFEISGTLKGTIQAIAVNDSGVASSVKKVSFTLKPLVTGITISGVSKIAKGKSSQLKAEILPSYAKNKAVTWTITKSDNSAVTKADGVTISSGGKVTVAKKATAGNYIVKAAAKDGSGKVGTYTIIVMDSLKVASAKFSKTKLNLTIPKEASYNLGSELVAKAVAADDTIAVSDFKWTSSNNTIATVSESGVVTPKAPGSVTITALANDASGKKATCKITIKQLTTGVSITGESQVGRGKKITLKAAVTPTNASNKKVTWKITKSDGSAVVKTDGVTINSSGVVSATAKAAAGTYKVTATAADGSGFSADKLITVKGGTITSVTMSKKSATIFRTAGSSSAPTSLELKATLKGTDGFATNAYTCTSSNPGIATASASETDGIVTINVKATGKATGKTTITVASTDGSNKKAACTVTVNNPVSKVNIAPTAGNTSYVAQGKTLSLKATLETEYGKVSNKGVNWTISGDEAGTYVKINSSGKITVNKKAAYKKVYTVTATAKDGSGAKGTYSVMVTQSGGQLVLCDTYDIFAPKSGYQYDWQRIMGTKYTYVVPVGYILPFGIASNKDIYGGVSVTSSNPQVVSATIDSSGDLNIAIAKAGSATITIKMNDGSGTQVKYKFKAKKY